MNKIVEVLPDKDALIHRSLTIVVDRIQTAIAARDRCTIALAGGSTPKPLYEQLATQTLPWEKIHIFWGDERYVPSDHPDSNEGMARHTWLDRVALPSANIHPMPTANVDPAISASQHEGELQQFFALQPGAYPRFDIILLGIGDDGHTASLFPHTDALQVSRTQSDPDGNRLITVGNKDGQPRITFTVPLINHAHTVLFMVAGASKRPALDQIFAPAADEKTYPARLIQPEGELIWLLDQAAGQDLKAV
jgi:6-phosphogluconolactonase